MTVQVKVPEGAVPPASVTVAVRTKVPVPTPVGSVGPAIETLGVNLLKVTVWGAEVFTCSRHPGP